MTLVTRLGVWLVVCALIVLTQRNGAVAMGEAYLCWCLIIPTYVFARNRPRVKRIKVRDPYGYLAREMGVLWLGPRTALVFEAYGPPAEIRAHRRYLRAIARGDA